MADNVRGDTPLSIGRYEVVSRIGHGAMGVVYSAADAELGRRVAVKVMRTPWGTSGDVRERFHQEGKSTARIAHPNVVSVFDLGEDQGHPYIVMELLEGASLADHLSRPEARALDARLDVMLQVCDGLQAAHARGVLHRGMKPGNVFVQSDGTVKILDFGMTSVIAPLAAERSGVAGASEYASPEQLRGTGADERSDIFSAAAVFYFILTGRAPFGRAAAPGVREAVMHSQPAALTAEESPEALARVLLKALDKDPARRHQSLRHLRAEIDQVRRAGEGSRRRVTLAAVDRYRQIETLIDERRGLSRRLRLVEVERECDRDLARLAARFPDFAHADMGGGLTPAIDGDRASAALRHLQAWHNDELAAVSVLRAAVGAGADGDGSVRGRVTALINRLRDDSGDTREQK